MDVTAVAAAMVGAQVGRAQLAMAAKMMKMNADNAASIIQVIEAAQQNLGRTRQRAWPEPRHHGLTRRADDESRRMTDIHDLRARMREGRAARPVVGRGGGFRIPFGLVAGCALSLLDSSSFCSRRSSIRCSAPRRCRPSRRRGRSPRRPRQRRHQSWRRSSPSRAAAQPPARIRYAGKGADEAAKIADAVCEQRMTAAPQRGQAAVEAKLHCLPRAKGLRGSAPAARRARRPPTSSTTSRGSNTPTRR